MNKSTAPYCYKKLSFRKHEDLYISITYYHNTMVETVSEKQNILNDYLPFDWPLYNKSQTKEKVLFLQLLRELCDTIQEP